MVVYLYSSFIRLYLYIWKLICDKMLLHWIVYCMDYVVMLLRDFIVCCSFTYKHAFDCIGLVLWEMEVFGKGSNSWKMYWFKMYW